MGLVPTTKFFNWQLDLKDQLWPSNSAVRGWWEVGVKVSWNQVGLGELGAWRERSCLEDG